MIVELLNFWLPWLDFDILDLCLQLFIVYILFLILFSKNLYYSLWYLFVLLFAFGLSLAVYQIDFFLGFLWLVELTVLFIFLLLCFYTNSVGTTSDINFFNISYLSFVLGFFVTLVTIIFFNSNHYFFLINFFNDYFLWSDYFEALYNESKNDFWVLFLNYFNYNSILFCCILYLLLLASIICILLNRQLIILKNYKNYKSLSELRFIFKFIDYKFLRHQSMVNQSSAYFGLKMFKRVN